MASNVSAALSKNLPLSLVTFNIKKSFFCGRKFTVTLNEKLNYAVLRAANINDKYINSSIIRYHKDDRFKHLSDKDDAIKSWVIEEKFGKPLAKELDIIKKNMSMEEKSSATKQTHALVSIVLMKNIINKIKTNKKNNALSNKKLISFVFILAENMFSDNFAIYNGFKEIKGNERDEKKIIKKITKLIKTIENKLLNYFVLKDALAKQEKKNGLKQQYNYNVYDTPTDGIFENIQFSPEVAPKENIYDSPKKHIYDSVAPKDDSVAPKDDSVAPKDDSVAPKDDSVAPKDDSVAPKDDSVAPKEQIYDSVAPKDDSVAPKEQIYDSVAPKDDSVAPKDDSVAPKDDSVAPKDDSVAPKDDSVAPKDDSVAPNKKTETPASYLECNSLSVVAQRSEFMILFAE